jgi:energy-coupling factor transporter ATP-binding protein EcfA2
MLGLSRKEARRRFESIIAFAELEEFVDLKLKNYSSGMGVRLAFSVAIQVDADILLVDEVLAVGDAAFQQKCYEQFIRLKEAGKTIVFVTHDMGTAVRFCDRALLLERGKIQLVGDPDATARVYNELNFGRTPDKKVKSAKKEVEEATEVKHVKRAEILNAHVEVHGEPVGSVAQNDPFEVSFDVLFNEEIIDPIFGITIRNDIKQTLFATSTLWDIPQTGRFRAGQSVTVRIPIENLLAPSRYFITPAVALAGTGAAALDSQLDQVSLMVHGTRSTGGMIELPHTVKLERATEPSPSTEIESTESPVGSRA